MFKDFKMGMNVVFSIKAEVEELVKIIQILLLEFQRKDLLVVLQILVTALDVTLAFKESLMVTFPDWNLTKLSIYHLNLLKDSSYTKNPNLVVAKHELLKMQMGFRRLSERVTEEIEMEKKELLL